MLWSLSGAITEMIASIETRQSRDLLSIVKILKPQQFIVCFIIQLHYLVSLVCHQT